MISVVTGSFVAPARFGRGRPGARRAGVAMDPRYTERAVTTRLAPLARRGSPHAIVRSYLDLSLVGAVPGKRRLAMIISVINHTGGTIADEEIQPVLRAINRQIDGDYAPYWSLGATLRLEGRSSVKPSTQTLADMRGRASCRERV